MGLTWAVAWFGAGFLYQFIFGSGTDDVPLPIRFAMLGLASGVTFSTYLSLAAGHRRFDQMSLGRFAGWGAAGSLVLYGLLAATAGPAGESLFMAPVLMLAGAGSAAGTLALARRAEAPRLLEGDSAGDATDTAAGQLR
jgi:hypothetical protein